MCKKCYDRCAHRVLFKCRDRGLPRSGKILGTASGNAGLELFLEQYERWVGGIETRNREMSNEAVAMGVDRFDLRIFW